MKKHDFPTGSLADPSADDLAYLASRKREAHYATFGEGVMVAIPDQSGASVHAHWQETLAEMQGRHSEGPPIEHEFPPDTPPEDACRELAELTRVRRRTHIAAVKHGVMLALPGQSSTSVLQHYEHAVSDARHQRHDA